MHWGTSVSAERIRARQLLERAMVLAGEWDASLLDSSTALKVEEIASLLLDDELRTTWINNFARDDSIAKMGRFAAAHTLGPDRPPLEWLSAWDSMHQDMIAALNVGDLVEPTLRRVEELRARQGLRPFEDIR